MIKKLRNFRKRCTAFLMAVMIVCMSLIDCAVYKPMEAQAAATTSVLSLLADLLLGLGVSGLTSGTVGNMHTAITDYIDTAKAQVANAGKMTIDFLKLGAVAGAGAIRSLDVTKDDLDVASDVLAGKTVVAPGDVIPSGLLNTMTAFGVQKLNISAVDGTVAPGFIYLTAAQYFDSYYGRYVTSYSSDGRYRYTSAGVNWLAPERGTKYATAWGIPGGTITRYDFLTGEETVVCTLPVKAEANGYSSISTSASYGASSIFYCSGDSKVVEYPVPVSTITPTVDTGYLDSGAVWNGINDLTQTIANQQKVIDGLTKDKYIDDVMIASKYSAASYNTLSYLLAKVASNLGITVDTALNDAFIDIAYSQYVQGSSAEKLEQSADLMKKFTVINGSSPDNDDNDFKVLNTLVNAYITYLIGSSLLPENTPQIDADTQIDNMQVVKELPGTDPDPSLEPTVDPDPGGDPDISLAGILEWLSKIYDGIISIPKHIKDIPQILGDIKTNIIEIPQFIEGVGAKILEIPGKISGSDFGIAIKSIPESLTALNTNIGALPDSIGQSVTNSMSEAVTGALSQSQPTQGWNVAGAFQNKFPFSIPWDVAGCISILKTDPVKPVWEVPFVVDSPGIKIKEKFVIDLSTDNWTLLVKVVRGFILLFFVAALVFATRSLIKG